MLKHYNIADVMIDSPPNDNLEFMSDVTVTANHSFIRFHGRDSNIGIIIFTQKKNWLHGHQKSKYFKKRLQ